MRASGKLRIRAWSRRNVLLLSFWYFALVFSAFLYYTYARWRPAHLSSALFDGQASEDAPSAGRAVTVLMGGRGRHTVAPAAAAAAANGGEAEEGDEDVDTISVTAASLENVTAPPAPMVEGYERLNTSENLRLHCGRCAVVSNSGHLINRSRGAQIDATPCVLRMNLAPTAGFERDVGRRTTVRVIGHVNLRFLDASADARREFLAGGGRDRAEKVVVPWLHAVGAKKEAARYRQMAANLTRAHPDAEFYFLTPEKFKMAEEIFKLETGLTTKEAHTWLTTGWMTLLFAIDVCDEIDIYGMVDEGYCRDHPNDTTPYHYFEPGEQKECPYYRRSEERLNGGHLFITEKAVFARWAHRFQLRFHCPGWDLAARATNASAALETPFLRRFYEAKRNGNRTGNTGLRKVVRRVVRRVVVRRKVQVAKKSNANNNNNKNNNANNNNNKNNNANNNNNNKNNNNNNGNT